MVNYRLIRNGKEYRLELDPDAKRTSMGSESYSSPGNDRLVIHTWKGIYTIHAPQQPQKLPDKGLLYDNLLISWFTIDLNSNDDSNDDFIVYHPLCCDWMVITDEALRNDIIEYILKQPPSPDWEGAKEDKRSIEETFTNILAEKTNNV